MKKFLLLATSALLLIAGCQKEVSGPNGEGGLQQVTFTATMDNGTVTKAAVDGDGAAASVNRCIMEIYYDGSLFARDIQPVTHGDKITATFTVQVVANRTYAVAFWADSVAAASSTPTTEELAQDLYYTTNAAQPNGGLQAIALKGTYAGNNDARDAFFSVDNYTIAQAGTACVATLKRPFAQVNVITTDWDKADKVSNLKPTSVDVTIKNPLTAFNALTGVASTTVSTLTYNADIYTSPASGTDATLSMDYLFASTDKAVIDIDWKAGQGTDASTVSHSFSNIPYQRNYRTNIKGNLLTSQGQWTVTVVPTWTGEYEFPAVKDIASANTAIQAQIDAGAEDINITVSSPSDAGVPGTSGAKAILTTGLPEGSSLNITVDSPSKELYIGDYQSEDGTAVATSGLNAATVNITVPSGSSITSLVINAPSKSVYVNGNKLSSVGAITSLDAITSDNTLVIEENQTVSSLTIRQGGLEIHGTVTSATVAVAQGKKVYVRACEGLSTAVYNALKDYIDTDGGYVGKQVSDNEWKIYASRPFTVDGVAYGDIYSAISAVATATDKTVKIVEAGTYEVGVGYQSPGCDYTIESTLDEVSEVTLHSSTGWTDSGHPTLKNLTFKCNDSDGDNFLVGLNFDGCTLIGRFDCAYANELTFDGCTFDCTAKYQYAFWTAGSVPTINVINCIFNTQGKAIKMYGTGTHTLKVEGCTFNDSNSGSKGKPAIAINTNYYGYDNTDYTVYIKECTANGFSTNLTGDALYGSDVDSEIIGNLDVLKYDKSTLEYVYVWKDGAKYPPAE